MYYLMITSSKPTDAGEILVIAKNSSGEVQARANIDVLQSVEFRNIQLRPSQQVSDQELVNREINWKKVRMRTLVWVYFNSKHSANLANILNARRSPTTSR
jgi:hypothetical protein